jgi:hypothetical protein
MSAPLSPVYPHRVELIRPSSLIQVVPAVIVASLLGIAGVGFAWSSAVRARHADTENYNSLEKRLVQTEQTNAQLRGQLSVVANRLQLTPEEQAQAQRIADRVRGMDAQQITQLDAELHSEINAKTNAGEVDAKVSGSELEEVNVKSHTEVAAVHQEVDNARKDMQASVSDLNTRLQRTQHELELLRTAGQHTDYDFALNGKSAKSTLAGVTIELQDTNLKKNQFNMTLVFGTTRLLQKDRSLDEPIFFYRPNDAAPMELVVNQLAKHRVSGRLIVPKSSMPTAAAASTRPSP